MIKSYIVTESSEFLSSDEEEDDEDVLSRETVRLLWHPNGSETVEEEKKVNLYCLLAHSVWAILQFCLLGKGRELRVLVHSEFLALITKHINVKFKSRNFTADRFYFLFFSFSFFLIEGWPRPNVLAYIRRK
jgi:hypothetical protein